jgi:hypothetical protein
VPRSGQLDPELHHNILDFVHGEVYAGEILDPKTPRVVPGTALARMKAALGSKMAPTTTPSGPARQQS